MATQINLEAVVRKEIARAIDEIVKEELEKVTRIVAEKLGRQVAAIGVEVASMVDIYHDNRRLVITIKEEKRDGEGK